MAAHSCPVCKGSSQHLDAVDFNKSCEEARGKFLPRTGALVHYYLCDACGFCFCPEIAAWSIENFEKHIYNAHYKEVDPDYISARPTANAAAIQSMFSGQHQRIKHLDYGGGDGLLSQQLRDAGWDSQSYDPFVDKDISASSLGKFDLITAFEVFEHVPDVQVLAQSLSSMLKKEGILIFSTLVSDGEIAHNAPLLWWYAAPRNGHISLFSNNSLNVLANQHGFYKGSFSAGLHTFWKTVPAWAAHLYKV